MFPRVGGAQLEHDRRRAARGVPNDQQEGIIAWQQPSMTWDGWPVCPEAPFERLRKGDRAEPFKKFLPVQGIERGGDRIIRYLSADIFLYGYGRKIPD